MLAIFSYSGLQAANPSMEEMQSEIAALKLNIAEKDRIIEIKQAEVDALEEWISSEESINPPNNPRLEEAFAAKEEEVRKLQDIR